MTRIGRFLKGGNRLRHRSNGVGEEVELGKRGVAIFGEKAGWQ